jgi:hypothetical protein
MTKSDKIRRFEYIYILRSTHLLFFVKNIKYQISEIDVLHVCGINYGLHSDFVFQFFKLVSVIFEIFKQRGQWCAGAKNLHPWEVLLEPVRCFSSFYRHCSIFS